MPIGGSRVGNANSVIVPLGVMRPMRPIPLG
jgi:hypothetical protein